MKPRIRVFTSTTYIEYHLVDLNQLNPIGGYNLLTNTYSALAVSYQEKLKNQSQ